MARKHTNENGKIVTRDDQGNKVPTKFESVGTEDIPIDSWNKWFFKDYVLTEGWLYHEFVQTNTAHAWNTSTSQDGSTDFFATRWQCDTGQGDGSAGDNASIFLSSSDSSNTPIHTLQQTSDVDWGDKAYLAAGIEIVDGDDNREDYYCIGNPFVAGKGVGIKLQNQDLVAVAHDGTSETIGDTLVSGVGTGDRAIAIDCDGPNGRVDCYVDDFESPAGSVSTGLPSGSFTGVRVRFSVENTSDVQRRLRGNEVKYAEVRA